MCTLFQDTYLNMCMHVGTHCYRHWHAHTYTLSQTHMHALWHAHTFTHTFACTGTHTHTHCHKHTGMHAHTVTDTHVRLCVYTHTHAHAHTRTNVIPGHVRRVGETKSPLTWQFSANVFRHFLHQISVCWLSLLTLTECTLFQCCYDYAFCVTMPIFGCCADQWTWCPSRRTLKTGLFAQRPSSSVTWCSCSPMPSCTTAPTTMSTAWPRRCMMMSWCT